ncbi:MAG TPA: DAK2 domain-containing protein [Anaerolineae bacterium]|jgi:dihydroxyacetone kinase
MITSSQVYAALQRAGTVMVQLRDELNELDAAMGDGDCGISVSNGGNALLAYCAATPLKEGDDIGKYLANAGLAFNRAAPSTMGTLLATTLMRAGKEAKGITTLDLAMLVKMASAADMGIQERGKAKPGDKTIVDALHPAAEAFAAAIARGDDLKTAGTAMVDAARAGRDAAIPLRSNIGRASWVGERTMNKLDPGTVLCVKVIEAIISV